MIHECAAHVIRRGSLFVLFGMLISVGSPQALAQVAKDTGGSQTLGDKPRVVAFALIDSDTDLPIDGFNPIQSGSTINLANLPTLNLNIQAITLPAIVPSVVFALDGKANYFIDSIAPYALAGDTAGDYAPWTPKVGTHILSAKAALRSNGFGRGLGSAIWFSVVDEPSEHVRINSGGPAYDDVSGESWTADYGFNGGSTFVSGLPIDGTNDDLLYQSERYAPNFTYEIPVFGGSYEVVIHLAELYWNQPGKRVFDIEIEGEIAHDDIDIFAQSGKGRALTLSATTFVVDGSLSLRFARMADNAKISAIEIIRRPAGLRITPMSHDFGDQDLGSSASPLTIQMVNQSSLPIVVTSVDLLGAHPGDFSNDSSPPYLLFPQGSQSFEVQFNPTAAGPRLADLRVLSSSPSSPDTIRLEGTGVDPNQQPPSEIYTNCGGPNYEDHSGIEWSADNGFIGGSSFVTDAQIYGTDDDPLYQSERSGHVFSYAVPASPGTYEIRLHFAELYWNAPFKRVMDVTIEDELVLDDFDIWAEAGRYTALIKSFELAVVDGEINIGFSRVIDSAKISAIEIHGHDEEGHPFLHVVIDSPPYAVDYDGNGTASVFLDGHESHTHEPGHLISAYRWTRLGVEQGTDASLDVELAPGPHTLKLEIFDDNQPEESLSKSVDVTVYPADAVAGVMARYYHGTESPDLWIDSLLPRPCYMEVLPGLHVEAIGNKLGGSPFEDNVVVVLDGNVDIQVQGSYEFSFEGGLADRLFIDGILVTGPTSLSLGPHVIEARIALLDYLDLPSHVLWNINNTGASPVPDDQLSHDESLLVPFINEMPSLGSTLGGETIEILGLGFFPEGQVSLHFGSTIYAPPIIDVSPNSISFTTPPGSGLISVRVETPNGLSNELTFEYSDALVPIQFDSSAIAGPVKPIQGAWGPDGRLYVATLLGVIEVYTFDDDYRLLNAQTIQPFANDATNKEIMGIAFNPFDPPSPVRIYLGHTHLHALGGGCIDGGVTSPYIGQVSILEGPNFTTLQPLITNLPTSNHDHAINGIEFDHQGNLLIAIGGNTNAGVLSCAMGGLDESPLTGGIAIAYLSKPDFDGTIAYIERGSGSLNLDQVFGDLVDLSPTSDVLLLNSGLRNPFDLVFTEKGELFATDNGPNNGFGPSSTGPVSEGPDPEQPDKIVQVFEDHYYGHPNRNRGFHTPRENKFKYVTDASIFGSYVAPIATPESSTCGITEYRSMAFNGQMRGDLLAQKWNGEVNRIHRNTEGDFEHTAINDASAGLDILTGPGGVIIGIDHSGNLVTLSEPIDLSPTPMIAYDIFPYRATIDSGQTFVIGGRGFGSLADTNVMIGGQAAILTSVSGTRIRGILPDAAIPSSTLRDVQVDSNGSQSIIPSAFRYVLRAGEGTGAWSQALALPQGLSDVTTAALDGVLYAFGGGSDLTFAYDIALETWNTTLPVRPIPDDHQAAEVVNGRIYLLGGLGAAAGKVQVYDPDFGTWTTDSTMPYAGGSLNSAVISGKIYVAGGLVANVNTDQAAVFDPMAHTWTSLPPMPEGRNHAAAGTDGARLFIFGGRVSADDLVTEGRDEVFIYDPNLGTWESSSDPGSTIQPLPQKRGGLGRALFLSGEFHILGGETTNAGQGQVPGNVYDRVDLYNPISGNWRLDSPIPTARHGVHPIYYQGSILLVGGRDQAGLNGALLSVEVFKR